MTALRFLETLHGHLGILAAAALAHPAILLRKGTPPSGPGRLSLLLATVAVAAAFATGLLVYPSYRQSVRTLLFHKSVTAGLLFETKEHVAFAVVTMALGACTCALVAPREATGLRRAAAAVYATATALCLATAGLGSAIAAIAGFGSR